MIYMIRDTEIVVRFKWYKIINFLICDYNFAVLCIIIIFTYSEIGRLV